MKASNFFWKFVLAVAIGSSIYLKISKDGLEIKIERVREYAKATNSQQLFAVLDKKP
jgi:hypothetical protein